MTNNNEGPFMVLNSVINGVNVEARMEKDGINIVYIMKLEKDISERKGVSLVACAQFTKEQIKALYDAVMKEEKK